MHFAPTLWVDAVQKSTFAGMASEFPVKNSPRDNNSRRKRSSAVETNDRFMKVTEVLDDTRNIWLVSHKLDLAGLPPHVRIIDERAPRRSLTVAESALLDRRLYHRLESAPRGQAVREQAAVGPDEYAGGQELDSRDAGDFDPMEPDPGARR